MAEAANEGPKFQQARRPEDIKKEEYKTLGRRGNLIAAALIGGGLTAAAVGSNAINEEMNKTQESFSALSGETLRLDTSTLRIDGQANIRKEALKPSPSEIEQGNDNIIDNIKSINGVEWDGKSDFQITNAPYIMSEDPTNRMQKGAWIALEIETQNGSEEIGFISNSGATKDIITTVTKGEIGDVKVNANKKLEARLDSGKTISHGEIGKVEILPLAQNSN